MLRSIVASHVWLSILVLAAPAAFASEPARSGSASPLAIPRPPLPSWIEDVSPSGESVAGSQVRIRFRDALIAVPSDAATRAGVLASFHLTPAATGEFRFVTPRLVTFEADAPLVAATRYRVTIDRGLSDLAGNRLDAPLSWTFDMAPIVFALSNPRGVIDTEPSFVIRTNARFDDASLDGRIFLEGGGGRIAVRVSKPAWFVDSRRDEPLSYAAFASASATLEADTPYSLVVDSGVCSLEGNLASRRQIVASFRTRGPLRLLRAGHVGLPNRDGVPGRFIDGAPALFFNNPIDAKTTATGITLAPPLANPAKAFSVSDIDEDGVHVSAVRIDPAQLAPDTAYVATVNTELADGYRQHASPSSVAFRTGVLPGTIDAPLGLTLVPPSAPTMIGTAFGVPVGFVRLSSRNVQPDELAYDGIPEEALPAPEIWSHVSVPAKGNATFPLEAADAAPASSTPPRTGLSAFAADAQSYGYTDEFGDAHDATTRVAGFIQHTDLGVFAESIGHVVLVRVSHLHDGTPVTDAGVTLLPMVEHRKANEPVVPCANGRTDANGIWISTDVMTACAQNRWWSGQRTGLSAIATSGPDWAFVPLGDPFTPHLQDIPSDCYGAIFTDRGAYRPGDVVHVSGIVDTPAAGGIAPLARTVTVRFDDGTARTARPDAFGRFALTWQIPNVASEAGSHDISVDDGNGFDGVRATIIVAEPRVPTFTNALSLRDNHLRSGDAANVRATVRTMTGAPVPGARVTFDVTSYPLPIAPGTFADFTFGAPTRRAPDATGNATTSAEGMADDAFTIPRDLQFPTTYVIRSDATAPSGEGFGTQLRAVAKPSHAFLGLSAPALVNAGESVNVRVIAVDADGNVRPGRHAVIRLQHVYGPPEDRHADAVAAREVSSAMLPQTVAFVAPPAGDYRFEASFDPAEPGEGAVYLAFTSAASGARPSTEIVLDRQEYRVGDVARAYVTTPFPDADVLVEVLGTSGVLWRTSTPIAGSGIVAIPIRASMLPNVKIRLVAVRRVVSSSAADIPLSVTTATADLHVRFDERVLRVRVAGVARATGSGATAHVTVAVSDASGAAVRAGCIVAIVDDAVLSLDGYRFPSLAAALYADRPVEDNFADNRLHPELTRHEYPMHIYSIGATTDHYSVGRSNDTSRTLRGTVVASRALPLAYFDATRTTDARGRMTIDVPLPGNRTRWRVLVVAATTAGLAGNGESTFDGLAPAELTTRVRFARAGDRVASSAELPASHAAQAALDTPVAPETTPAPRVVDAGTIASTRDIVTASLGDHALLAFHSGFAREIEAAENAMVAKIPFALPSTTRDAVFAFWDRGYLAAAENDRSSNVRYGSLHGEFGNTAYGAARFLAIERHLQIPKVFENVRLVSPEVVDRRLISESNDPVAAGVCEPADMTCIRRAELLALDGLQTLGTQRTEHLDDLLEHVETFTLAERYELAALLVSDARHHLEGERLAERLDQIAYVGAQRTLAPAAWDDGSQRSVQIEALRLALARNDTEERIDALVRGLLAEAPFPFPDADRDEALIAFAQRFPAGAHTVDLSIDGAPFAPVELPLDAPSRSIDLPPLNGSHHIVLEPRDGAVSYELETEPPVATGDGSRAGIAVTRSVRALDRAGDDDERDALVAIGASQPGAVTLPRGAVVAVVLKIVVDHPVLDVLVIEPIPAGLEALDTNLSMNRAIPVRWPDDSSHGLQPHVLADRLEAHLDRGDAGTYELRYLARVVAPGTFTWPAAYSFARDGSGDAGSTADATVTVR